MQPTLVVIDYFSSKEPNSGSSSKPNISLPTTLQKMLLKCTGLKESNTESLMNF